MTTEQINRAIAKALGWTCPNCGCGVAECSGCDFGDVPDNLIPNFTHDLNAMHEAEKTLTCKENGNYWEDLLMRYDYITACAGSAPAIIRAEAFLRVKGLWEDNQ